MLSPTADTVRLFLHVLAAAVWVGGQFALAGIVPTLRRVAPESTRAVANAFARVAWPAFAVLVVTGIWNIAEVDVTNTDSAYQVTLMVKITLAILSGCSPRSTPPAGRRRRWRSAARSAGCAPSARCSSGSCWPTVDRLNV